MTQETLRYHCIVYHLAREATRDDVIPLAYPITTEKGETISEIPVARGQVIMPNIAVYNRYVVFFVCGRTDAQIFSSLPQVWGDDAQEWNPMRFIDSRPATQIRIGMFGNTNL